MRFKTARAIVVSALSTALVAGCSGSPDRRSQDYVPGGPAAGGVLIRIQIPRKHAKKGRRPSYVSQATQSLSIVVTPKSGGHAIVNETVDLTPASPACTPTPSGTNCTIVSQPVAPGSYDATVATFSGLGGSGSVLSQAQNEPFTVVAGVQNQILLTLYGVPRNLNVVPDSTDVTGSLGAGFSIGPRGVWATAQRFEVSATDANGYTIVGPGSPTFSVVTSNQAFTLTQPTQNAPGTFQAAPPATAIQATTQLTLKASFADASTCQEPGATCSQQFALAYAPFADDDWTTFAHDNKRTGLQTQDTEISATSVSGLTTRWKVTLGTGFVGSPVVYNGMVIVANQSYITALSAATGQMIWRRFVGSTLATPTIDTTDGLVFIGQHDAVIGNPTTGYSGPSNFYALKLSDGSIAWQHSINGSFHSSAVYANGYVYEGIAGGDANDGCMNGGVVAFDAVTGLQQWEWYTNSLQNPGGGGGVWGALAFDGSHIIFGTGNTCQATGTMQGAASLNTDGSMLWAFVADTTQSDDADTGGGVMVQGGNAVFINKNGTLYSVDLTTGAQVGATPLGAHFQYGGFSSPSSDGSITVVGAGFFPESEDDQVHPRNLCYIPLTHDDAMRPHEQGVQPNFTSAMKAVDNMGNVLWSIPMTADLINYAAITNGVVFAGADSNLDAIDISNGNVLWQLPGSGRFHAGPVLVPSGLYVTDYVGNVYALALPDTASPSRRVNPGARASARHS